MNGIRDSEEQKVRSADALCRQNVERVVLTPIVALVAARIGGRSPLDLGSLGLGNRKILKGLAFLLELVEAVGQHGLLDFD